MRNKCKKIFSGILASALALSALSMSACGGSYSQGDKLDWGDPSSVGEAKDNGGFSVEYGDYVYFINGQEAYTVENKFGDVTKGALMRIKKSDLDKEITSENYNSAEMVVPMLFVSQNFEAGIYIYDGYVYYATPTTDKNMSGAVENSWIDFKRASLDGTDTMKDYYFRLSNNAANYRFVEVDDVVYCLYEEDGALKSFNTATEETTVLVSGAKAVGEKTYYFDQKDLTNPNVYYVMNVAPNAEAPNAPQAEKYDQVYCVNAAAALDGGVKETETTLSYTVKGGATYEFNRAYMKEANDKAKDSDMEAVYDFDDYTTFPYVNLGTLVLDGIGSANTKTQFNEKQDAAAKTFEGYNYTIQSVQNGGVYFTRTEVMKTNTSGENTNLYFVADKGETWNAISANEDKGENPITKTIAYNTTNTTGAYFYVEDNAHKYLYVNGTSIYRVDGLNEEAVRLTAKAPTGATLWKVEGDYVYYTAAAADGIGNAISRIKYNGDKEVYAFLPAEEYQQETIDYVNFNATWYKPEIYGNTVLYSNVKTFGSGSAYNYVYAAKLDNVKANNEAYKAVQDYIDEYSVNADLQAAMRYYFRTGETKAFDAVKDLYDEYQKTEFDNFTKNAEFKKEGDFVVFVGKMTDADSEAIDEAWVNYLRTETEEEESEGLATWAIVLIVVGGVLVVAAAVLVPLFISMAKKKEAQRIADETVNAYKRPKIDTTDDKSIDVYADETPAEEAEEEATEEAAEEAEVVEETAEEVVEETTEEVAPVEEPAVEVVEEPAPAPVEEAPVEEPAVAPAEEAAPAPVEEVPAPVEEATDSKEE